MSAHSFDVGSKIECNPRQKIKNDRKTYSDKRSVDKKEPDFGNRNTKPFA
jgi:hypothetical protein